jgi:hypothetical protein
VVLEPTAVSDLVEFPTRLTLQARAAEEGRSFLSKKGGGTLVGEKLFPDFISLRTDPFHRQYSALPWQRLPSQIDVYRPRLASGDAATRAAFLRATAL